MKTYFFTVLIVAGLITAPVYYAAQSLTEAAQYMADKKDDHITRVSQD